MKRQIKVNKNFAGHLSGKIIDLECDDRGNIKDQFCNARMRDSKIDECVEFVESVESLISKGFSLGRPRS